MIFSQVDYKNDQTKNCWLQMAKLGVGLCSGKYSHPKKVFDLTFNLFHIKDKIVLLG